MVKAYARELVYSSTLDHYDGDHFATDVFLKKYALKNDDGSYAEISPVDMFSRIAKEFARIEQKYVNPLTYDEIYSFLSNYQIIPQGSPLSGIGNNVKVQSLSNCFVIESPYDSYGGILLTDQQQVQIMKRRGGVGFDISTIRPKGLKTENAAITTDGIGVFMERYSNSTREVAQNGRRGALMITISCHHYELDTFINIKKDLSKVTGANISIRVSDEFMTAVEKNEKYSQRWPVDSVEPIVEKWVDAREVWNKIIDAAYTTAEPGVLFWDSVLKNTPSDVYAKEGFRTTSTNPCSELPLNPTDSCRLMVVNLYKFVKDPFTSYAAFDTVGFGEVVKKAQRLMDDLVDLEAEKIDAILDKIKSDKEPMHVKAIELSLWEQIKETTLTGRRTGLGLTGLADCLAALNVRYGTDESVKKTEELYKLVAVNAYASSIQMAKERGKFKICNPDRERSIDHEYLDRIYEALPEQSKKDFMEYGRRNIALTTTSPCGTISTLAGVSAGIEPAIFLQGKRRRKINPEEIGVKVDYVDAMGDSWQEYEWKHKGFIDWQKATGLTDVVDSPYHNATALDTNIDWRTGIKLQAAAQKWVCHAISKTVNMPKTATKEDVLEAYTLAWKLGCKGITVYVDGSRSGVFVSDDKNQEDTTHVHVNVLPRPKKLLCDIHRANVVVDGNRETYMVLVGKKDSIPYEIFCGLSKHVEIPKKINKGYIIKNGKKNNVATYNLHVDLGDDYMIFKDIVEQFSNPNYGAFSRVLSLSLRHGIPLQFIVEQLLKDRNSEMLSFNKAIARVLKEYIPNGTRYTGEKNCPECGSNDLIYVEGCMKCRNCSYEKCS